MEQPTSIGRYQIVSELGRGGMATVYRAYDPLVRRDVAIKLLPREFMHNPDFRARFEQEAHAVAGLEHPGIVPIYDFGEDDDQPYIVMRLLTGGSLSDRIKDGPMPLTEVARIIAALAPGLDEAHAQGIIHRDIKPANILFDGFNNPHLSDFGLAKMVGTGEGMAPDSGMFGTPEYMAPEMAHKGNITRLIDIYALGVTIYEMLTNKPPFEADTPVGLLLAHAMHPIPVLHDSLPDLPEAAQDVLDKVMAKAPADRYQFAADLASDLESLAATGKTQRLSILRRDRTPELDEAEFKRHRQRRNLRWALVGGGTVVVIVGGGVALSSAGLLRVGPAAATPTHAIVAPAFTPTATVETAQPGTSQPTTEASTPQPTPNPRLITMSTIRSVQPVRRMIGHTDIVNNVAWSINGLLASASADKTVVLWNVATGDKYATLTGHTSWVRGLAFSPDGTQLVTGSSDHKVIFWDVTNPAAAKQLHTLELPLFGVNGVAWSPDSTRLALSPYFTTPILYSVQTGQIIRELKGHDYQINDVSFSPDGSLLASGSSDARIILWDALTGDPIRELDGHKRTVLSVSWNPKDSHILATGSEDTRVIIWDASTGQIMLKLVGHTAQVTAVTWSPDGTLLASGSADGTVRLWNPKTGDLLRLLDPGAGPVLGLSWSPDGTWIAAAQSNGSVVLWGLP